MKFFSCLVDKRYMQYRGVQNHLLSGIRRIVREHNLTNISVMASLHEILSGFLPLACLKQDSSGLYKIDGKFAAEFAWMFLLSIEENQDVDRALGFLNALQQAGLIEGEITNREEAVSAEYKQLRSSGANMLIAQEVSKRWAVLHKLSNRIHAAGLSRQQKDDLIFNKGFLDLFGCGGVRLYSLTTGARAWHELSVFGDAKKITSRSHNGGLIPTIFEEKYFVAHTLFEVLQDMIGSESLGRYEALGCRLEQGDGWALFHIPDRWLFDIRHLNSARLEFDQQRFPHGNIDELVFLFVGDFLSDYSVGVYQLSSWAADGYPIICQPDLDLDLLTSFADTLAMNQTNEKSFGVDGLTGLYERKKLKDYLITALNDSFRSKQPLSVVMFDLDHFKRINDNFGHTAGDEVLRRVGEVVRRVIREDDFAVRYGGEEFIIVMKNADPSKGSAGKLAERLRAEIKALNMVFGDQPVTISVGVAGVTSEEAADLRDKLLNTGLKEEELPFIKSADSAMYKAKAGLPAQGNNGRDQIVIALSGGKLDYLWQPAT